MPVWIGQPERREESMFQRWKESITPTDVVMWLNYGGNDCGIAGTIIGSG